MRWRTHPLSLRVPRARPWPSPGADTARTGVLRSRRLPRSESCAAAILRRYSAVPPAWRSGRGRGQRSRAEVEVGSRFAGLARKFARGRSDAFWRKANSAIQTAAGLLSSHATMARLRRRRRHGHWPCKTLKHAYESSSTTSPNSYAPARDRRASSLAASSAFVWAG